MTLRHLVLLRHGQTDYNAAGKMQGHLNSVLTPEGRAQATVKKECGARLPTPSADSVEIQAIEASSASRVIRASASPICRPRACRSGGRRPAMIEMKMMLSMPRTISKNVRVSRLIIDAAESSSFMGA